MERWAGLKKQFFGMVEHAPPQAGPPHFQLCFEPLNLYLTGFADAKGIKPEDVNRGLVSDRTGMPLFLAPKKPGEDPEVK